MGLGQERAPRLVITKDYRVLLNIGDNFGDFTDAYRGTEEERQKVFDENKDRWGREWIVIANPTYGSFEVSPLQARLQEERRREAQDEARRALVLGSEVSFDVPARHNSSSAPVRMRSFFFDCLTTTTRLP